MEDALFLKGGCALVSYCIAVCPSPITTLRSISHCLMQHFLSVCVLGERKCVCGIVLEGCGWYYAGDVALLPQAPTIRTIENLTLNTETNMLC